MKLGRREIVVAGVLLCLLTAAVGAAGVAGAAPAKSERVVSRSNASLGAEALKMAKKVDFGLDGAVITYQGPGDKRPRKLTIGYSEYLSAAMPGAGPLIYFLLVGSAGLVLLGLLFRIVRIFRRRAPEPAVAMAGVPFAERRKDERRQDKRRQGERRHMPWPALTESHTERRKAERRQGERRQGDRRQAFAPAQA